MILVPFGNVSKIHLCDGRSRLGYGEWAFNGLYTYHPDKLRTWNFHPCLSFYAPTFSNGTKTPKYVAVLFVTLRRRSTLILSSSTYRFNVFRFSAVISSLLKLRSSSINVLLPSTRFALSQSWGTIDRPSSLTNLTFHDSPSIDTPKE